MADPAKIEAVLALIEAGESENAACKAAGINRGTFRSAVLRFGLADVYARACEALARDQVEQLEATITDMREGRITTDVGRIEADTRKWIASKLFKQTWGDKLQTEHTGTVTLEQLILQSYGPEGEK